VAGNRSLSINPSNQGLKPANAGVFALALDGSLSINPSNQGLKLNHRIRIRLRHLVSIHQSIKSRVETDIDWPNCRFGGSLYPSIHQIKG